MRLTLCLLLPFAHNLMGAVIDHGPIVHWNQDPGKSCQIVWLERSEQEGIEGRWSQGAGGFGYGDADDATTLSKMKGRYQSMAIRNTVQIPAGIPANASLVLRVDYDDGFIAWIDGQEIARRNLRGAAGDLRAAQSHEAGTWEEIPLGKLVDRPKLAGSRLALRGFNNEIGSSDFTLHPELLARSGNREWQLVAQGQSWEYLANAEPEQGWQQRELAQPANPVSPTPSGLRLRHRPKGTTLWKTVTVSRQPFAKSRHGVLRATIQGLPYGKDIEFQVIDSSEKTSPAYSFRMPATTGPIRFVTGGDLYHKRQPMDEMNRVAGKLDPLFALIGGDLAYANDSSLDRWFDYIDSWAAHARTPDGRLVPKVVAIGNHEIKDHGFHPTDAPGPEAASMFYSIFKFPGDGSATHAVDVGDRLSLVMLDSGHTRNIAAQNDWLKSTLAARRSVPNLFVAYHRPAWGCGAKDDSKDIQQNWCPIFENQRVSAVFEYDHHVFCRSHPLTKGKIDPENGIPYLGSGAWSVAVRKIDPKQLKKRPWVAASGAVNHLYLVETEPSGYTATAIDIKGKPFDRFHRVWKR